MHILVGNNEIFTLNLEFWGKRTKLCGWRLKGLGIEIEIRGSMACRC